MKSVHENKKEKEEHICESCGKVYGTKSGLYLHIVVTHEKLKRYKCDTCNKDFGTKSTLDRHVRMVHNQEKTECEICGKMLGALSAYKIRDHMNTHTGHKPHKCKFCGQAFADNSNKISHEKSVHLGIKRSGARKIIYAETPLL